MQAEVLTHFLHAESPRCIGCPNCVIPLRVLLSVPNYRFGYARNKTCPCCVAGYARNKT